MEKKNLQPEQNQEKEVKVEEVKTKPEEKPKPEPKPEPGPPPVPEKELSREEKVLKFLTGKKDYVKLNDFLKSLYPLPKLNEPPSWLQLGMSKELKGLLEGMQAEGKLDIADNRHNMLGKIYYEGDQQYTRHHNLSTVEIWAKIIA